MSFIYAPRDGFDSRVNLDRCRASVAKHGRAVGFRQCSNKITVVINGYGYCAVHDPSRKKRPKKPTAFDREIRRIDINVAACNVADLLLEERRLGRLSRLPSKLVAALIKYDAALSKDPTP